MSQSKFDLPLYTQGGANAQNVSLLQSSRNDPAVFQKDLSVENRRVADNEFAPVIVYQVERTRVVRRSSADDCRRVRIVVGLVSLVISVVVLLIFYAH